MSHDISTVYTRNLNKTSGRRGYGDWKRSKDTIISPKAYGGFIQERKRNKRRWYRKEKKNGISKEMW